MGNLTDTEKEIAAYIDVFYEYYRDTLLDEMNHLRWIAWDAVGIATAMAVGLWQEEILGSIGVTYDDVKTHVDTMVTDPETKLWDVTHYYASTVDDSIGDIRALLGFGFRTSDNVIISQEDDVLHRISDIEYTLEYEIAKFDEETIEKLTWVADHYDQIKALAEDDITYIVEEVQGRLVNLMKEYVDPQIDMLMEMIFEVDEKIAHLGNVAYRAIMWLIEWILTGFKIPPEDISEAIADIHQWIEDEVNLQTIQIKAEVAAIESVIYLEQQWWIDALKEKLEITGNGNGGLSATEIQTMINASVSPVQLQVNRVEGDLRALVIPTEEQVKKWIEEATPTIIIAEYIDEIDRALYDRMNLPLKTLEGVPYEDASDVLEGLVNVYFSLEDKVISIEEFLSDDMRTSLTDIVEAFGTPEALLSYLVNAPEGQEEPMLDLMQILLTMSFERGL